MIKSQGWTRSAGRMNSTGTECIEISGIPQSIEQIDLEMTVLNVFDKIDAPVDPQNVEAYHRLKSGDNGQSNKVIVKFSKRKDMVLVMYKKKSLKNPNLDGTGLPPSTSLFINPNLCSYHKYLWSKCKALWSVKLISSFWVSNGSLRVKLEDDTVKSVTHKDDLKVLFPGYSILMDKEQVFIFGSIFCILDVFKVVFNYYHHHYNCYCYYYYYHYFYYNEINFLNCLNFFKCLNNAHFFSRHFFHICKLVNKTIRNPKWFKNDCFTDSRLTDWNFD